MTDGMVPGLDATTSAKNGRIRGAWNKANQSLDNANEASKRLEETAHTVAAALVCIAVLSVIALGMATAALIVTRRPGEKTGATAE